MSVQLIHIRSSLETERTILRRYQEGDGPELFDFVQRNRDRLWYDFFRFVMQVESPEEAESTVRRKLADWYSDRSFYFGIRDKKSDKLIGEIGIKNIHWDIPKGEVGYFLDRDSEGKGIMSEALKAVIEFTFEDLGFRKLLLRTGLENYGSQRVACKNGFTKEGVCTDDFLQPDGITVTTIHFGLNRENYLKMKTL